MSALAFGTFLLAEGASTEEKRQSIALGVADQARLERISDAWRRWATSPDGWYVVVHGEILCRV